MNSINVIDSYFEGKLLIGIVATTGNVVRIEGNTIENMGGPAVIANQIGALTVRASQPSVSSLLVLSGLVWLFAVRRFVATTSRGIGSTARPLSSSWPSTAAQPPRRAATSSSMATTRP